MKLTVGCFTLFRRAHERPPPHPHRMHPNYGHGHHIHVPQTMSSHPRQAPERSAWLVIRYYFNFLGLGSKDSNVLLITVLAMLAVIFKSAACTCSLKYVDVDMALKYCFEYSVS